MRRFTSDRWLAVGTALSGIGAVAVVGYWIYVLSGSHRTFWHLPGVISGAVLIVGVVMLGVGFFSPGDSGGNYQSQRAGDRSTNVQIGGDVRIGRDK